MTRDYDDIVLLLVGVPRRAAWRMDDPARITIRLYVPPSIGGSCPRARAGVHSEHIGWGEGSEAAGCSRHGGCVVVASRRWDHNGVADG